MNKISIFMFFTGVILPAYCQAMDLTDLQNAALKGNPAIRAMEAEAQMMKERIPQSSSLDDPRLKLGVNNLPAGSFSFTQEDMTSAEIGISQMIPVGKLGYRKKIAGKEYEKALARLKAEKVEILNMLRMSVYDVVYTRASIRILEDIKKQIRLIAESEIAATKSGMGSVSNVVKANAEYVMVDEEIISLKQKEKELNEKINYITGGENDVTVDKLPDPDFRDLQKDEVYKGIELSNPELKIFLLDAEISGDEISLKKFEYVPDVEIGLSYMMRRDGPDSMKRDNMISGMLSFNIPVWFWKKNVPMVDEMKKKREAAGSMYMDKLNEFKSKAGTLLSQMERWRDLYKLYRDRLIPQEELALETNLGRYRTGSVEFMPVVDTVRMLLRYRIELVMSIKEYYASYSELNSLMGVEVMQ